MDDNTMAIVASNLAAAIVNAKGVKQNDDPMQPITHRIADLNPPTIDEDYAVTLFRNILNKLSME